MSRAPQTRPPIVVMDLETVRSEVPAVVKPGQEDRVPAAPHHRIVCAGLLALDAKTMCVRMRPDGAPALSLAGGPGASERDILVALRKADQAEVQWVTFNGRGFDWSVVIARCMRHRIVWPALFQKCLNGRYETGAHLDLMDQMTWFGASSWPSADAVAKSIGMPGKGDIGGSDVQRLVDEGRLADVEDYVLHDIVNEAGIAMVQALVSGFFGKDESIALVAYQLAARSLVDLIDTDDRLLAMRPRLDRELFLYMGEGCTR